MFGEVANDVVESVIESDTPIPVTVARKRDDIQDVGNNGISSVYGYAYASEKMSATTVLTVLYTKKSGNTVDVSLYTYRNYGRGKGASFTASEAE